MYLMFDRVCFIVCCLFGLFVFAIGVCCFGFMLACSVVAWLLLTLFL